ncbi:chaperone NapD [Microbulbifer sp. CAU 1566]|uniref:chaperone NapD n=1 Tax=Microbulbifer sp. CAU 1566 TaxID=2933269 RepID=UPI002005CBA2|nr:chaperone NapD [Microbulbifer sp. CAU 1566]MCK7598959.1 chaperone NapD [Microbulbifer sp. CAU 1566]
MTQQKVDLDPVTQAQTLHIVSLIVHVRPEHITAVSCWFESRPELEIHLGCESGKLVVVLETQDHLQINGMIETIKDQPGVLNVSMVYHEELALADINDELVDSACDDDQAQPVKILGEL